MASPVASTSRPQAAPPAVEPLPEPEPPRPKRRWTWLAILLVLVVLGAVGWYWWSSRQAPAPATPAAPAAPGPGAGRFDPNRVMPVIAQPVRRGTIDVYLNALGTVTPRNLVAVKPRVDGQLMKVYFEEGQVVKAGQLLAEIDPRPFQVQLAQAQGQLGKDQALLANAQVDLERYRTLLAQDSIAKQQVDTQEALVRQYQGTIQADQAAVDNAKLQLTYARVTAPIGGRAGLRQVDPGNIVRASDANGIVTIAQLQPVTATFPIPEDNLPMAMRRLAQGLPTVVEAWDREGKNKLATGKLVTADNQIDTATGTVKMKAEFGNEDSALFPNQFVNVRMLARTLEDATLAPTAAIQRGAPGTFVYVVKEDSTVSVAPVKLGPTQGDVVVVESGVRPGMRVVVDGADRLREGARVDVVTRDSQAVAPAKQGAPKGMRGDRPPGERGFKREGGPPKGEGAPPKAP